MRYIRFLAAWVVFALGDLVSKTLNATDGRTYRAYNALMLTSVRLQGDSEFGPWSAPFVSDSWSGLSKGDGCSTFFEGTRD